MVRNYTFLGIIKIKGNIMSTKYPVLVENVDDSSSGYKVFIDTTPRPLFHTILHNLFHNHVYSFKYFGLIPAAIGGASSYKDLHHYEKDTLVLKLHKDEIPYNNSNIDVLLIGSPSSKCITIYMYEDGNFKSLTTSDIDIIKIIETTNFVYKEYI